MFCRICGAGLADGAAFCGSCGSPVPGAQAPVAPESTPTVPLPVQSSPEPMPVAADLGATAAIPMPVPQDPTASADPYAPAPQPDPYAQPYAPQPDPYAQPYAPQPDPYAQPYAPQPDPYAQPYAPQYAAQPPVPPTTTSKTPLLIGVGVLVGLLVAAGVLWQTGVIPGWLNGGSKVATSTVDASGAATKTTDPQPSVTPSDTITPDPDEPGTSTLSDFDSYDALVTEWETVNELRAAFGEKFPGASSGTGWIFDTWSREIGNKKSRTARVELAARAEDWVDTINDAATAFSEKELSPAYASYQDDLMGIYAFLAERADVYYQTSLYAVDHPTISKGNEPWRAVQDGKTGTNRAASAVLEDLQDAASAYEFPSAP